MGTTESPPPALLLRNLIASLLIYTLKSVLSFAQKSQLLETFRVAFLFFLRFVPSSFLDFVPIPPANKPHAHGAHAPRNDSGIGRALSQLLSAVNDIPVSSRKYEMVRGLAERVIEENHREGSSDAHALRRVNREVLAWAFARTLGRLEAAARGGESGGAGEWRVLRAVGWRGGEGNRNGVSAEKLGAELLWVAEKMADCGCGGEAVRMWAAAQDLGWLALSAEPRLQASLLKLAGFLFKELAKNMEQDETEGSKLEPHVQIKLKMLQSWLPLLCRANNGTDAPVLSISARAELERVLEGIIEGLEQEEEQEHVLSLWLHHFTRCPSSDWPNLHACYARWCNASRKQLLLHCKLKA